MSKKYRTTHIAVADSALLYEAIMTTDKIRRHVPPLAASRESRVARRAVRSVRVACVCVRVCVRDERAVTRDGAAFAAARQPAADGRCWEDLKLSVRRPCSV